MAKKTPSTGAWGKATAAKRYAFGGTTSVGNAGGIPSQAPNPQLPGGTVVGGGSGIGTSVGTAMGNLGAPQSIGGGAPGMAGIGTGVGMAQGPGIGTSIGTGMGSGMGTSVGNFGGMHPGDMGVSGQRMQRRLDRRAGRTGLPAPAAQPNPEDVGPHAVGVPFDGWNGRKRGGRVGKGKK